MYLHLRSSVYSHQELHGAVSPVYARVNVYVCIDCQKYRQQTEQRVSITSTFTFTFTFTPTSTSIYINLDIHFTFLHLVHAYSTFFEVSSVYNARKTFNGVEFLAIMDPDGKRVSVSNSLYSCVSVADRQTALGLPSSPSFALANTARADDGLAWRGSKFEGVYVGDGSCVNSPQCCCATGVLRATPTLTAPGTDSTPPSDIATASTAATRQALRDAESADVYLRLDGSLSEYSSCFNIEQFSQTFTMTNTTDGTSEFSGIRFDAGLRPSSSSSGSTNTNDRLIFKNSLYQDCTSSFRKLSHDYSAQIDPSTETITSSNTVAGTDSDSSSTSNGGGTGVGDRPETDEDYMRVIEDIQGKFQSDSLCVSDERCCCTQGPVYITPSQSGSLEQVYVASSLDGTMACLNRDVSVVYMSVA